MSVRNYTQVFRGYVFEAGALDDVDLDAFDFPKDVTVYSSETTSEVYIGYVLSSAKEPEFDEDFGVTVLDKTLLIKDFYLPYAISKLATTKSPIVFVAVDVI